MARRGRLRAGTSPAACRSAMELKRLTGLPKVRFDALFRLSRPLSLTRAANASVQTRLGCYKSYVNSQYRRYVDSLIEHYAPKLREATGLTMDLQPFFGCPLGQDRYGRVNWHPRNAMAIADAEHWHPLFVLEPIIELMRLAQADSV